MARANKLGLRFAAGALAVCTGLTACGSNDKDKAAAGSATAPAAGQTELEKALTAQVSGDLSTAKGIYEQLLSKNASDKYALYNLGVIAQTEGDKAKAEDYFRRTLAIDGNYPYALYNLAILRTAAGDNTGAADLYQRMIATQPDSAKAHLNYGFVLKSMGREDEAATEFNRALAIDPSLASRLGTPVTSAPSESPSPQP